MSPVSLVTGMVLAFCGQAAATFTRTFNPGSVATCDVRAVSKSSSVSVTVAANAVEKVDAVLCGPEEDVADEASSSAHAIATAFAEAITEVVADCYAKGTASFKVKGKSVASAQAHAIAQAYAAAYVTAKTCHKCSAASELVIEGYEDIFLKATSEATVELEAITDGEEVTTASKAFTRSFVEKTVVAFAEAIVKARAAADSCKVSATTKTHAGDVEDSNDAVCKIGVVASDDEKISNAAVAIATSVSARACGKGFTSTHFEVEAEALAKVMSIAVSEISGDCHVKGKGTACALGEAHMTKTAKAVATAFASGFATATNTCSDLCDADTDVVSDAIGSVLATATSEVYKKQCDGPDSYFDVKALDKEIVEATATALSSILTSVSVSSEGECIVEIEVKTSVTPSPGKVVSDHDTPHHGEDLSEAVHPHDEEKHSKPDSPPHGHPSPAHSPAHKHKGGKPRPAHKPTTDVRPRHGKTSQKRSAAHRDRKHGKQVVKPKKMRKYKVTRPHSPVRGKTLKVRPTKQRIHAAQLAMARKRARTMRRRATKGKQARRRAALKRGKSNGARRQRIRTRAPRRARRVRRSRKPRQG